MPTPRTLFPALGACAVVVLAACGTSPTETTQPAATAPAATAGNAITGEGLPNPAPKNFASDSRSARNQASMHRTIRCA